MELFDLYTELNKRLKKHRQTINCFFPGESVTNGQLKEMYRDMFILFEIIRQHLATSAKIHYHPDSSSYHINIGVWHTEVKGEKEVNEIANLSHREAVNQFMPSQIEIIKHLPPLLKLYRIKRQVLSQQQYFALEAFDYLLATIESFLMDAELSQYKDEYPRPDSNQFELTDSVFFYTPDEEGKRALKIATASHVVSIAAEILEEAQIHRFLGKGLEELREAWAKETETQKIREMLCIRHQPNRKRQNIIIDVYENRGYKDQYNQKNNKTNTARHILKHVNERCRQENIPTLKEETLAGVRTIIKCIDEHIKKESMH